MKKNAAKKRYLKKSIWGDVSGILNLLLVVIISLGVILTVWYMNKPQAKVTIRTKAAALSKYSIYYDDLAQGWLEWSDANVDPKESKPVYSGLKAISYRSRSSHSPLYFHTRIPINTSSFTTLHFALYGKQERVKYAVALEGKDEKRLTPLASLDNFGGQPETNKWKLYEIPLIFLGAQDKDVYGIYIQSMDSSSQTLYIDEIDLRGSGDNGGYVTPTLTQNPTKVPTVITTKAPTSIPTVIPTVPVPTTAPGDMWRPTSSQPLHLHWQLTEEFSYPRDVVSGANVYDIDGELADKKTVDALHNLGAKVICYIDVGVFETYRSDASKFPGVLPNGTKNSYTGDSQYAGVDIIGTKDQGWDGSYWLDIRRTDILRPIMEARIRDWCKAKGFDAVEPDESEVWDNKPGFPITQEQNVAYSRMIADIVHSYGMSVGLKGNNAEAADYASFSDWSLSEECYQYKECDSLYNAFAKNNKAVFIVEYQTKPNCSDANSKRMNAMFRDLDLVGPSKNSYVYEPCVSNNQQSW